MSEQAARPLASKHQYDKDVLISSHCQLCKIYVLSASKLLGLSWKLFSQSLSLVFCWLTLHRLEIERLGQDPVDIDGFKPCIYFMHWFQAQHNDLIVSMLYYIDASAAIASLISSTRWRTLIFNGTPDHRLFCGWLLACATHAGTYAGVSRRESWPMTDMSQCFLTYVVKTMLIELPFKVM